MPNVQSHPQLGASWEGFALEQVSGLRVSVQEIRAALSDAARAPQYLATVGRQGYRWLGGGAPEVPPPRPTSLLVGRQSEVALLAEWSQHAAQGTRQLVFLLHVS